MMIKSERYDVLQEIVKSKEYKEKNVKERGELLISLIGKINEQEYQSLKGALFTNEVQKYCYQMDTYQCQYLASQ